jgi:polyisoprenoid-binding protein YceI
LEGGAGSLCASGNFEIDLESFDSGNPLRDYNVRTAVLNTPIRPRATFRLLHTHPIGEVTGRSPVGRETSVDCVGELTLNGVTRTLHFRPSVTVFENGFVSARTEADIVIRASDFGLDISVLKARCGALVDDEIRLGFRLAVPYASSRAGRWASTATRLLRGGGAAGANLGPCLRR